jgi:membrane-associated phospholipid phosphatase
MVFAHVVGSPEFYWAIVSEVSLLVWTALLLMAPRLSGPRHDGRRFRLLGLGAALLAALVTLAGKLLEVWPGNPLFPSGHTAYAVTIAVFLAARDRRWLRPALPLLALLAVALVLARYHVVADVAGGLAVGLATGFAVLSATRSSPGSRPPAARRRRRAPARSGG